MSEAIEGFFGSYRFLSNFWPSRILGPDGLFYPTAEHAYQAAKALSQADRLFIAKQPGPADAKRAARSIPIRPDWEEVKEETMKAILLAKFSQHPDLREKLLATKDSQLLECNIWNDEGDNTLGRMLMEVRSELRK
jgi:hypothetical protein